MKLAETTYDNRESGCCARLDVDRWDGREITWDNQPFLKDRITAFMHIPLNFGRVMTRDMAAIEAAEGYPDEPMWLSDESSPWGSDVLVATDREIPGSTMEHLSGRFIAKVFEGPFRDAGKWISTMQEYVRERGYEPLKTYFWYTTCPNCAKKLGANHVVLISRVG